MADNLASNIQDTTVSAKELEKTLKTVSEVTGRSVKNLKEARTAMQGIAKDAERLSDAEEKYHGSLKKALETQKQQNKQLNQNLRQTESLLRDIPKGFSDAFDKSVDGLRAETLRGLEKDFNDMADRMNAKLADGMKLSANDILSMKDKREVLKRIGDLNKAAANLDSRTFGKGALTKMGDAKSLFQSAREGWRDRTGNGTRVAGNVLKEKGALRGGLTGKMMGGLGGGMAAGAKFIPIAGQIIGAISAVNDMINAADRIQKGSRQDYAALAGPQFEGAKFANRSHTYNTEIRDIQRNQKLGVGHQEWNGMFQSMSNAGMTVTTLEDKVAGLGDVMTSVRKSSLNLGLGLETTGDVYATQFLEMSSGLDTVYAGMKEVAKGAKVAGVETSKFYQSVAQSTLTLASYGNFTAAAANSLKKFQNSSGTSKQNASEMSNNAMTVFENMSAEERMAFVGTLRKSFGDLDGFIDKYIADQKKILENTTNPEERQKVLSNIEAGEAAKTSTNKEVAVGNLLPRMPQTSMKFMMDLVRTLNHNNKGLSISEILSGDGALADYGPLNEFVKKNMKNTLLGYESQVSGGVSKLNSYGSKVASKGTDQEKKQYNYILALMKKGKDATGGEQSQIRQYLEDVVGVKGDDLVGLEKFFKTDMKIVGEEFENAYKANIASVAKGGKANNFVSKNTLSEGALAKYSESGRGAEGESLQVSGQSEMIRSLTPLEKMTQIAKDSYIYQLSDSKAAQLMVGFSQDIRDGIWKLVGVVTGNLDQSIDKEYSRIDRQVEAVSDYINNTKTENDLLSNLPALGKTFGLNGHKSRKLGDLAIAKFDEMNKDPNKKNWTIEAKAKAMMNDSSIADLLGGFMGETNGIGGFDEYSTKMIENIDSGKAGEKYRMLAEHLARYNNTKPVYSAGANSTGSIQKDVQDITIKIHGNGSSLESGSNTP